MPDSASANRNGLLALLLPLATVVGVLVWQTLQGAPDDPDRATPPPESAAVVDAWTGSVEDAGRTWSAVLSRMHVEPDRQAFEARVLRERYGRGEGEPWRLSVRASDEVLVDLGALTVRDGAGATLAPLSGASADHLGPTDRVLLPPADRVPADGRRALVLWGAPPGGDLELVGLDHEGRTIELPLAPDQVPFEHVDAPLWTVQEVER
jgi:hypothetical protein